MIPLYMKKGGGNNAITSCEKLEKRLHRKKTVKKVKKRKILTKGEKIIYTFFSMVVLIAAIYIVSFASTTDGLNRDIQKIESEVQQHKVVNKDLAFEISELSKPERITKIA